MNLSVSEWTEAGIARPDTGRRAADGVPAKLLRHGSNPFSTRYTRPGSLRYCFDDHAEIRRIVALLLERRTGVIVGPHGTGKSTLLHTLLPTLEQTFSPVRIRRLPGSDSANVWQRWRHVRQVDRDLNREMGLHRYTSASQPFLLVVDGAEQISAWQRGRLVRWSRRFGHAILATSHQPLSGMDLLYRTGLDAKLVEGLTMQLLADATPEIESIVRQELDCRDLSRVSNLREFWFELYDVVQPRFGRGHLAD